ncbi:MAG TPA: cytochrome c oxidase subunit II transmembrane domain-containing protein, partial [Phycisphaerae bacterium]|nr:cytochrome c oxidase subunit II transmembrane domain-containing protein [Phycisphaerae bacterium]
VSVFFTALIFFLMVFFTIRYRHKIGTATPAHKGGHSTTLELTWTIIPTIIVLVIFYFGFRSYLAQAVIPPDAYEIQVNGRKQSFTIPAGKTLPLSCDLAGQTRSVEVRYRGDKSVVLLETRFE